MQQNDTPSPTAKQMRTLESLLSGRSVTASAEIVNVDRSTVHRWLREDSVFQARYNQMRRELHTAAGARILDMADKAASTVAAAIEEGDTRTALRLLEGLGFFTGKAPQFGSESPEQIDRERALFSSLSLV